jgi:hypothetical protein
LKSQNRSVAYGKLFRNRSFVALWFGQTMSFVGDYFCWLAIPIMVERLTGSSLSHAGGAGELAQNPAD